MWQVLPDGPNCSTASSSNHDSLCLPSSNNSALRHRSKDSDERLPQHTPQQFDNSIALGATSKCTSLEVYREIKIRQQSTTDNTDEGNRAEEIGKGVLVSA